ncbi:helix-turn-helix domain-containing protein [Methylobacterium gossipiicola]|uniref:helix-turn-helix domain-containing protein n=1 Tax=Methylobacterium gossipiicola TaxID=582675 RepID=UPI0015A71FB8|nr:helix-turn-helix transcriptional regulator [Methylobacterium gossipiicola]
MSENFGEKVRRAREAMGWSQEYLAAKVGTTQSTIDRIESGLTRRSRVLPDVAKVLDLNIPKFSPPDIEPKEPEGFVRVTVLVPSEIIQEIKSFQSDRRITSENEAIVDLLDIALKSRDDYISLTERFMKAFNRSGSLIAAASQTLVDHPNVARLSYSKKEVAFEMLDDSYIWINSEGLVEISDYDGKKHIFEKGKAPYWASEANLPKDD